MMQPIKVRQGLRASCFSQMSRVFQSLDPFDCRSSSEEIKVRVGYGFMYNLTGEQFAALSDAASLLGETEAYISVIEGYEVEKLVSNDQTWRLALDDIPYKQLRDDGWTSIQENCVYSIKGTWALKIAHTSHAVIGGAATFVDRLTSVLPEFRQSALEDMAREWGGTGVTPDARRWFVECLGSTLGTTATAELLANAGWSDAKPNVAFGSSRSQGEGGEQGERGHDTLRGHTED